MEHNGVSSGGASGDGMVLHSNRSMSFNKALEVIERARRARRRCAYFVIDPEKSQWLRHWDMVTAGCLIFVCFISPYEVAFTNESSLDAYFVANRVVDIVFIIDMVLQFFIMYPVTHRFGTIMVADQAAITKRYLKSWFAVDLVSVLPFDLIGVYFDSEAVSQLKLMRVVRLVRLLKLIRLFRTMRIVKRWELEVGFSYRKLTLIQLFIVVVVAAHWISCILGIMDRLPGGTCTDFDSWEEPDGCTKTWLSGPARQIIESGSTLTPLRAYIVALHTAATIIVHPHANPPTSDGERVCFIILIFMGGFVWTRVISKSTATVTSMNRHSINWHQTMDDLNANSKNLGLNGDLKRKLRGFFRHTKDQSQRKCWNDLVNTMSPFLQRQVQYQVHRPWITRVNYLSASPRIMQTRVAGKLVSKCYAEEEIFGSSFALYIMHSGSASRVALKDSRVDGATVGIKMYLPGAVWGEEHLLLNAWWLLTPNTARAMSFIEVLSLEREAFEEILKDFDEFMPVLRKYYLKAVVIHGIKYEANRRRRKMSQKSLGRQKGLSTVFADGHVVEEHLHHHRKSMKQIRRMRSSDKKPSDPGTPSVSRSNSKTSSLPAQAAQVGLDLGEDSVSDSDSEEAAFASVGSEPTQEEGILDKIEKRLNGFAQMLAANHTMAMDRLDALGTHVNRLEEKFEKRIDELDRTMREQRLGPTVANGHDLLCVPSCYGDGSKQAPSSKDRLAASFREERFATMPLLPPPADRSVQCGSCCSKPQQTKVERPL